MDIHNLATVMTPNILYPNTKNSSMDESFLAIEAVSSLITYNDTMCEVSSSHKLPFEIPFQRLIPSQVPEDLQSILNDASFFKDNADITTKEILKRYGDFGKGNLAQKILQSGEMSGSTGSTRSNNAAATARIETDPSQAAAWQMQSSVRHVQAPGSSQQSTEHAQQQTQQGDYRDRSASAASQQAMGRPSQSDAQQQLPYRPHAGTGPMGVAG